MGSDTIFCAPGRDRLGHVDRPQMGGVRSFIITFAHAILAYMAPPSALLIEPSPRSKLV